MIIQDGNACKKNKIVYNDLLKSFENLNDKVIEFLRLTKLIYNNDNDKINNPEIIDINFENYIPYLINKINNYQSALKTACCITYETLLPIKFTTENHIPPRGENINKYSFKELIDSINICINNSCESLNNLTISIYGAYFFSNCGYKVDPPIFPGKINYDFSLAEFLKYSPLIIDEFSEFLNSSNFYLNEFIYSKYQSFIPQPESN